MSELRNNLGSCEVGNLGRAKINAILLAEALSRKIIDEHPEIATDYRGGLNHREIAIKYNFHDKCAIGIARRAVGRALETLIPDSDEREKLSRRNKSSASRTNGSDSHKKKVGIYGKDVIGKNIIAKGEVPWSDDEIYYIFSLTTNLEFIHQKGSGKGRPDRKKIADKLNAVFHDGKTVRNTTAVMSRLYELRKAGKIS